MEEVNILKLSIEDRCQHHLWKARVNGYEAALNLFQLQDDGKSAEFSKYLGLLKKFVTDRNEIAQEKGLSAVLSYVQNAACAPETVNDVMSGLVSKCFSSPRAKTRELALEITLMYIEIEKHENVLEELIKGMENKSPKVAATSAIFVREALHAFGPKVISIKALIKILLKLLEDKDQTVREKSKQLFVEIYRWVGDAIKPRLHSLKPLTLAELEIEFQKLAEEVPAPTRYLKSQQGIAQKMLAPAGNDASSDVKIRENVPIEVDPYDLMTAVDILAALPKNFYEQCKAKEWHERKAVLEALLKQLTYFKLKTGNYGDLVRVLKNLIGKDSHILVVTLATKCLTKLVLGLRKKFQPYASACIPTIFEKFKEKKHNVVVALREAIDALYDISSFDNMLEDIQYSLDNKNPQVKAETCAFLTRCFCKCSSTQLNKKLLKVFTTALLKNLNDADAGVRENCAKALGTAQKVVGERTMSLFLQEVSAIKMAKIKVFCDKAVVTAKLELVDVQKKPSSAPFKAVSTKIEDTIKPSDGIIKKPVSAGASKKFKETELTEKDILKQVSEFLSQDVINGLSSSKWKKRLASAEKISEIVQQLKKNSIPAQPLIKLLAKKPGFKDTSFKVLKLRFEILTFIVENAKISHISVDSCLSDVVDKIGDAKTGIHAGLALTAFASATSLEYISLEVLNSAFNKKNLKNQSEALIWVSNAIKHFGLKIKVKKLIKQLKKALSSTNPAVQNAALALVGTLYIYVGKPLRYFFENEKPALLQQIDAEFEKSGNSAEAQVNLADLLPPVNISNQITSQLLSDLSNKDWHLRTEALQKISNIISEAKYVTPDLGDLPSALKRRLGDANKKIAVKALNICQMLGISLGSHASKQIRNFAPAILVRLGDSEIPVRAAAVQCLNAWMDQCPLANLFEGEIIFKVLKAHNPFLRTELFGWLIEKLPKVSSLPATELNLCVPILLSCLEDRNADVRKNASNCLKHFMVHVGYESMSRAASKLKPASKTTVVSQLEKVRQNLLVKPSTKVKQTKPPALLEKHLSPPQVDGEENAESKMNTTYVVKKYYLRSTSKHLLKQKVDS